jgi:DNA repair protein RadC
MHMSPDRLLLLRAEHVALESPLQRLDSRGVRSLSDAELLSLVLRDGSCGRSALELAEEVLADGGIAGLLYMEARTLLSKRGFGDAKAATIMATVELARRQSRLRLRQRVLDQPKQVATYLYLRYFSRHQEIMGALYLNGHNHLIGEREHYRGTIVRAVVEPRAILRGALELGASGVVAWHTHPSGDPEPSLEDLAFTRRLAKAGEVIGVRLRDHLIVGHCGRYVSLKRRGGWI